MGQLSGRIGDLVYCRARSGRTYVREAGTINPKATALQEVNRKKMAATSLFLSPLRELINEVWQPSQYTRRSSFGSAFSYMMLNAFAPAADGDEAPVIRYDRILLCRGLMPLPPDLAAANNAKGILVSWTNPDYQRNFGLASDEDLAITVLYFPGKESFLIVRDGARRCDLQQQAFIPAAYAGCTVYAWLIFTCSRGRSSSSSVYLGQFIF